MKEYKKEIKKWISNPYNASITIILLIGLIIRFYFLFHTQGQPLWWDEAEYLSEAKSLGGIIDYTLNSARPPLFQVLSAIIFSIGLGEQTIRFLLVILPSTLIILAFYLLGKELYDERAGLISAIIATFSWTFLFWTNRVQPDFISILFQVLAIFFMWRYWKNEKIKDIIWAAVLSALAFYFKISALLVPIIFLVFILLKDRFGAFTNKNNYYYLGAFIVALVPYMIWGYVKFGKVLAFIGSYSAGSGGGSGTSSPFAWHVLGFFKIIADPGLFYILFLIGLLFALRFILYTDILIKDKKKIFNPDLFCVLSIIIISAFYIFYIRSIEDRWVFLWIPFMGMLIAKPLVYLYDKMQKQKGLAVFICVAVVLIIAYMQFSHASSLINSKSTSYSQVKDAGLWIKDNSNKEDIVISTSRTQTAYYSERQTLTSDLFGSVENFTKYIEEERPRYFMISIFENTHPWVQDWIEKDRERLNIKRAYFADQEQKQAILILYEINY